MIKAISPSRLSKSKFKEFDFTGAFLDSFGKPEMKSRWLIYGYSGEGKTELSMQLFKYFTQFGKAVFYSKEQGYSSSLRECVVRNCIGDLHAKTAKIIVGGAFADLVSFLKKNKSVATVIIDSVDYLELTIEQYKLLIETFPKKAFVFVAWKDGNRPKNAAARAMEYMVDIKIEVKHFVAFPRSRYGGNLPFVIWEEGAKKHHAFLNI